MKRYDFEEVAACIRKPGKTIITTHQRPDGDAIGSSLGLYHYLKSLGHDVTVITPTDYAPNLKWVPGDETILVGPSDLEKANALIQDADYLFCLDFNDLKRIEPLDEAALNSKATRILVDHHMHPKATFDLAMWDDDASSTAEMVGRIIDMMGDWDRVGSEIATALYTGILTDTGSFRYTSTTPDVHRMVARLMEAGAPANQIFDNIFANDSERRLRLFGHSLSSRLKVLPEYNTAYIALTSQDVEDYNIGPGDTEGLVSYTLSLRGIIFGVFMIEKDDMVKMSFRSRGTFPANEFAGHFNGGGHFHAAGGRMKDNLEQTESKFLSLLEDYKTQLLS